MGALLRTEGLRRAFGETLALADASIEIAPGETHALVGENGSGKSTFVKILTGVVKPDAGRLVWDGEERRFATPRQSQATGVAAVFQETLVVEELSVLDNVLLGTDGAFRHGMRGAEARRRVRSILDRLGMAGVDIDTPMWRLSLSRRQMVTVARALVRPWRLLVLDEVSSALDIEDRDALFSVVAEETAREGAVLLISHRMDEIDQVADRVTVMRSGHTVRTLDREEATRGLLLELMSSPEEAGVEVPETVPRRRAPVGDRAPVLRAHEVRLAADCRPFDLDVRPGEVLGFAGLQGNGQEALMQCMAGHRRPEGGTIEIALEGGRLAPVAGARAALKKGIAYVPGDRKREGIFPPLSVLDNQAMPTYGRNATLGVIRGRRARRAADAALERLRVVASGLGAQISGLSGGNQQKVLLGRWLAAEPRVLLLNDPLRGVDLGARLEICAVFRELADAGMAVVFYSTEIEELLMCCDRVAVMHEQSLEKVLVGEDISQPAIIAAMFGGERSQLVKEAG